MAEKNTLSILESIRKKIQKLDEPKKADNKDFSDIGDEFDYVAPVKKNTLTQPPADQNVVAKPAPIKTDNEIEREITESFETADDEQEVEESSALQDDEQEVEQSNTPHLNPLQDDDPIESTKTTSEASQQSAEEPLEDEEDLFEFDDEEDDFESDLEEDFEEEMPDLEDDDLETDLEENDSEEDLEEDDLEENHSESDPEESDSEADLEEHLDLEEDNKADEDSEEDFQEENIVAEEKNSTEKSSENSEEEFLIKSPNHQELKTEEQPEKSDEDELEELLRQEASAKIEEAAKQLKPATVDKSEFLAKTNKSPVYIPILEEPARSAEIDFINPAPLQKEVQTNDLPKKTFTNVDEFLTHNDVEESLLNQKTASNVADSIKKLVDAKNVVSGVTSFSKSEAFADIAAQLMEPRLEKWLNENLPSLVEKIVRDEIKKIIPKE